MAEEEESTIPGLGLQLSDVWAIIQMQRGVVVLATLVCFSAAVAYCLVATRKYTAMATLHVSTAAGEEFEVDKVVDFDAFRRHNRGMWLKTQMELIRGREMRLEVLRRYEALGYDGFDPEAGGAAKLAGAMEVTPRQGTELLDMRVTTSSPETAAVLANLLAECYRELNLDGMHHASRDAKGWLDEQLAEYRQTMDEASGKLFTFQAENDMADAQEKVSGLSATMSALNTAFGQAQTNRVLHQTTVKAHETLLRQGHYEELAKDMDTNLVAALTTDYARVVTQFARIQSKYGEKHPERLYAAAELDGIRVELEREIQRTLAGERAQLTLLEAKEQSLSEQLSIVKSELLDYQTKRERYDRLNLELERAKDYYKRLSKRNEDVILQSKTQLNNVRIIGSARAPAFASSPNVPLVLGAGAAGGFVLGLLIGFAREYLNDTVSTPLDVTAYLKVPFIGLIPRLPSDTVDRKERAMFTHFKPRSTVAEAVRAIRTVLELDRSGNAPKRLLFTSAISAEGKTSTTVHLGIAFANLGKRVLILDADLRRPRIHRVFDVPREEGITTVLTQGRKFEEVIAPSVVPNLHFMPAGSGVAQPNELLASTAFSQMLNDLEDRYDLLLIDSPPSVPLSDAQIISRYVDGVVLLVRANTASRRLIREAIVSLEKVSARLIGVIVNDVDLSQRSTSYKYYYGYGYKYSYGSGYYDDAPEAAANDAVAN